MKDTQTARTGQQQTATGALAAPLTRSTIFRLAPGARGFVVLSNATAQDSRLSFAARGMLVYLLSKPDDWQPMMGDLEREGGQGRDATRRIFRELETHGYVVRERRHIGGGRFGWLCLVHPLPQISDALPPSDSPLTEKPLTVKPSPVKASIYKKQNKQKTEQTKNRTHTPPQPLAVEPARASVCVADEKIKRNKPESRFSRDEWQRYAEHLQATGQGIIKPTAYASTRYKSGEDDALIEAWLSGKSAVRTAASERVTDERKNELRGEVVRRLKSGSSEAEVCRWMCKSESLLLRSEAEEIVNRARLEARWKTRTLRDSQQEMNNAAPAV